MEKIFKNNFDNILNNHNLINYFWWCYTPSVSSFLSNKPTEATIFLDVCKSTEQLKKEKADFMDPGAAFESYELAIK